MHCAEACGIVQDRAIVLVGGLLLVVGFSPSSKRNYVIRRMHLWRRSPTRAACLLGDAARRNAVSAPGCYVF
eukprot:3666208-Alexandrium_andersonii.AAC.1